MKQNSNGDSDYHSCYKENYIIFEIISKNIYKEKLFFFKKSTCLPIFIRRKLDDNKKEFTRIKRIF